MEVFYVKVAMRDSITRQLESNMAAFSKFAEKITAKNSAIATVLAAVSWAVLRQVALEDRKK